tara:strand:+ start:260 stop:511 length:252 start_codon:yes stop_codon:yes gene_type:complete
MRIAKEFKKTLEALEILRGDIEQHISIMKDDREELFDSRSERWQESEIANDFQEDTDELDSFRDEIESLFTEIDDKIEEIKEL